MKRFFLTSACVLVLAASAFSQGTINFVNTAGTLITLRGTSGVSYGPMYAGMPGQFRFQLFMAPAGTLNSAQFVATSVIGTNTSTAGRFVYGRVAVTGAPPDGNGAILIRGWSSYLGADYETARNNWISGAGWLGESAIAPSFYWGPNLSLAPTAFGGFGIQSGFELVAFDTPEPSAVALSGLGIASLMVFRRRRRFVSHLNCD